MDIKYIPNMKKNKFKVENTMKLSINVRQIIKSTKIFTPAINSLKIEPKEEDFITLNIKNIILLICLFFVYTQVSILILANVISLLVSKPLQIMPIIL